MFQVKQIGHIFHSLHPPSVVINIYTFPEHTGYVTNCISLASVLEADNPNARLQIRQNQCHSVWKYMFVFFGGSGLNYEIPVDLPSQNFSIRKMVLFDVLLASDLFYNHYTKKIKQPLWNIWFWFVLAAWSSECWS